MTAFTDTRATLDGCGIRLLRGGPPGAPPLMFLHGAGGLAGWQPFLDRLAGRFDVLAPEHPGFGQSDMPGWLDSLHDLAYFYLDFMAEQKLRGVHLVGLSLGGWLAAEIAICSTARLATLTLVDAAGLHVPGVAAPDMFLMTDEQRIRATYHRPAVAEAAIAALSPEGEDVVLKNKLAAARLMWSPRLHDPNLRKWLHRIDVPTLVVWGEHDRLVPVQHAAAYAAAIPGARTVIFPDCGHVPTVECPAEFCDTLEGFIAAEARP